MSESVSEQRDKTLVLNINSWLNNSVLPPDVSDLDHWNIHETVHEDTISVVEVGATVYNTTVADFLETEDNKEDDHESNTMQLKSIKMEQLRVVFDFTDFQCAEISENDDESDDISNDIGTKSNVPPPILAIYQKRNGEWQQVFAVNAFNDPEIEMLCSGESMMDDVQQSDLSLLFESLSKKQLIAGIQSFLRKQTKQKINYFQRKIPSLKDMDAMMQSDREYIQIAIAQIVAQNEEILDEFNSVIDDDLDHLVHDQFQRNLRNLKLDLFEDTAWDEVLEDIDEIVKKAKSFSNLGQHLDALSLVETVCTQFLVDFVAEIEEEDRNDLGLNFNGKFNKIVAELESLMERICKSIKIRNDENVRERLVALERKMKEWRKKLSKGFGPLFSDNIRALGKKLQISIHQKAEEKTKRKPSDDEKEGDVVERPLKRQRVR